MLSNTSFVFGQWSFKKNAFEIFCPLASTKIAILHGFICVKNTDPDMATIRNAISYGPSKNMCVQVHSSLEFQFCCLKMKTVESFPRIFT